MNNLEYLNQISRDNRPETPKQNPTTKLIIRIAIGGIAAFALILILAALLKGDGVKSSDLVEQLYLKDNNLSTILTTYGKTVKSSDLRAISSSLNATLTSSNAQLAAYITSTGADPAALKPTNVEASTAELAELEETLTNAKLNGIMDRIYASQLKLQVSILLGLIATNIEHTQDETLLPILTQFQSNVSVINVSLDSYSSPK